MQMQEIREILQTDAYAFLKENEHLGKNIILLGLGGSHSYGTNTPTSDLDCRGIALNSKREILTGSDFGQVVDEATDTTIYSFRKIITLLSNCNPNTIELLGLKDEQYLYLHPIGQELLAQKKLFLSKKAAYSFGGYASAQLRRLDNKSARMLGQAQREQHILKSIQNAKEMFPERYFYHAEDAIRLYIDKAVHKDYESEIFMDVQLKGYPLRDYAGMWSEMQNIIKDYNKLGKRNANAIAHDKLGKHMMHLIRLYMMCLDILEQEEIITYREKEHDELMAIRSGKYLDENSQPTAEFYEMLDEYEKRLDYAKQNTALPDLPDYEKINEFVISVHERVVKDSV